MGRLWVCEGKFGSALIDGSCGMERAKVMTSRGSCQEPETTYAVSAQNVWKNPCVSPIRAAQLPGPTAKVAERVILGLPGGPARAVVANTRLELANILACPVNAYLYAHLGHLHRCRSGPEGNACAIGFGGPSGRPEYGRHPGGPGLVTKESELRCVSVAARTPDTGSYISFLEPF